MKTNAESTTTSSLVPSPSGGQLQPSERGVARPEIPTELNCSRENVTVMSAMLFSLFYHTLSPDVMELSMMQAKDLALRDGVTEEQFDKVMAHIKSTWKQQRARNPIVSMF